MPKKIAIRYDHLSTGKEDCRVNPNFLRQSIVDLQKELAEQYGRSVGFPEAADELLNDVLEMIKTSVSGVIENLNLENNDDIWPEE